MGDIPLRTPHTTAPGAAAHTSCTGWPELRPPPAVRGHLRRLWAGQKRSGCRRPTLPPSSVADAPLALPSDEAAGDSNEGSTLPAVDSDGRYPLRTQDRAAAGADAYTTGTDEARRMQQMLCQNSSDIPSPKRLSHTLYLDTAEAHTGQAHTRVSSPLAPPGRQSATAHALQVAGQAPAGTATMPSEVQPRRGAVYGSVGGYRRVTCVTIGVALHLRRPEPAVTPGQPTAMAVSIDADVRLASTVERSGADASVVPVA